MPQLQSFDSDVWNSFCVLSPRRLQTGMGPPCHIQITEIIDYVEYKFKNKYNRYDRDTIVDLLVWLDGEWMTKVNAKIAEEDRKQKAKQRQTKAKRR